MNISLRYKFIGISVVTVLLSFTVAALVLTHFERQAIFRRIDRTLSIQAEMVDINSQAALTFADPKAANEVLSALRADCSIVGAWMHSNDGQLFASYCTDKYTLVPFVREAEGIIHEDEFFTITRKIRLNGTFLGTITIMSDLSTANSILNQYLVVMLLAMGLSCLGAMITTSILQQGIIFRIQELANGVGEISDAGNYKFSVKTGAMDEIGRLISGFNRMIQIVNDRETQIQEKTNELEILNAELEQRVQERTIQLEASNKELEAFSYSVAHDLRAPLRHIDGFVDMLSRHIKDTADEKTTRYLNTIGKSARELGQLVDHLLVFSRMGKIALAKEKVPLATLIEEIKTNMMRTESQRSIEWQIQPLPEIQGDVSMMRLVFENLISNAIKYSRNVKDAVIQIGCQETANEFTFSVIDNGAGFDQQYADKLFGVFQRLHASSEFEGTGIGLANVRRIIARHGGKTWATGEVDKGAKFYFSLPKNT